MPDYGLNVTNEHPFLKERPSLSKIPGDALASVAPKLKERGIYTVPDFLGAISCIGDLRTWDEQYYDARQEIENGLSAIIPDVGKAQLYLDFWSQKMGYAELNIGLDEPLRDIGLMRPFRNAHVQTPNRFIIPGIKQRSPIRDQGDRQACVVYSIVSDYEIRSGKRVDDNTIVEIYNDCLEYAGSAELLTLNTGYSFAWVRGWVDAVQPYEPGQIDLMKEALSGAGGRTSVPIVAVFDVFASNLCSRASSLFGEWRLPWDAEACVGAHAVTLVGYEDDDRNPGGGCFLAKESRGPELGGLTNQPGYTRIPYMYVQKYCRQAMSASPEKTGVFRSCIRRLEHDSYDVEGRHCVGGSQVIARPCDQIAKCGSQPFMLNTSENRKEFLRRGMAWNPKGCADNFFLKISDETKELAQTRNSDSDVFFNAAKNNFTSYLEKNRTWLGWESSQEVPTPELSGKAQVELARQNGFRTQAYQRLDLPELGVANPDAAAELKLAVDSSAKIKLWRGRVHGDRVYLVGLWVAPLRFAIGASPAYVVPKYSDVSVLFQLAKQKLDELEIQGKIVYTIGSSVAFSEAAVGNLFDGAPYIVSVRAGNGWKVDCCGAALGDEFLREIAQSAVPTSADEAERNVQARVEETTAAVLRVLDDNRYFQGNRTVEYVTRKANESCATARFKREEVERALDELAARGELETYQTSQTPRGDKAYRQRE